MDPGALGWEADFYISYCAHLNEKTTIWKITAAKAVNETLTLTLVLILTKKFKGQRRLTLWWVVGIFNGKLISLDRFAIFLFKFCERITTEHYKRRYYKHIFVDFLTLISLYA